MLLPNLEGLFSGKDVPTAIEKDGSVTVILNLYKRVGVLELQIESLLKQTLSHKIDEIWICIYASPAVEEFKKVVRSFNDDRLKLIVSDTNYKYYGRFQMAAGAESKYVLIIDDDMIAAPRWLELLYAASQHEEIRGVLGAIGWLYPPEIEDPVNPAKHVSHVYESTPVGQVPNYRRDVHHGGVYLPDSLYAIPVSRVTTVDMLCSTWFVPRSWIPFLFYEGAPTYGTGEDFMLSYVTRKYAHAKMFVLPSHESHIFAQGASNPSGKDEPPPWKPTAFSADVQHDISDVEATTSDGMVDLRWSIALSLMRRGDPYVWTQQIAGSPSIRLLVVLTSIEDLEALIRHLPDMAPHGRIFFALGGSLAKEERSSFVRYSWEWAALIASLGLDPQDYQWRWGFFHLPVEVGEDDYASIVHMAQTIRHAGHVIQALRPACVVARSGGLLSGSAVMVRKAWTLAAAIEKVPLLDLPSWKNRHPSSIEWGQLIRPPRWQQTLLTNTIPHLELSEIMLRLAGSLYLQKQIHLPSP